MKTYAFVFARGGSKGVPGKNIRALAGKPLLAYSIDLAKKIEAVSKIFVSTEDETIASIARDYGALVINRPEALAQDDTPEWLAWQHAVEWLEDGGDDFDVFLSLPTTSPLRNKEDIHSTLTCLDDNTDIVLTMATAVRIPWFNMVRKTNEGFISLLMKNDTTIHRRQDAQTIYDLTTVAYVTRPEFIKSAGGMFEGQVKGIKIPVERALDIDSQLDFEIAEFLINRESRTNENNNHAG
jgi:CMP-N-acetylneuraminic acid synthetase